MTNNTILPFSVIKNTNDTFKIECCLTVYREKLGKHPDFLKPTGDSKTGYYTKYFLLIKDDIQSISTANTLASEYNTKYVAIINSCETTGNWANFPFKDCEIVYYK